MTTRVGIALVRRGKTFLVRRRPDLPGSPMPGYWEFPGGKCEEGESPDQAARRECLEESGLEVDRCVLRRTIHHTYPHGSVELNYFDCELLDPASDPARATGFVWQPLESLASLRFPDANDAVIAELLRESS